MNTSQHHEFERRLEAALEKVAREVPYPAPKGLAAKIMERVERESSPSPAWFPFIRRSPLRSPLVPAFSLAAAAFLLGLFVSRMAGNLNGDPIIRSFTVDRQMTALGGTVTLRWEVEKASRVFLKDSTGLIREVTGKNEITVTPYRLGENTYELIPQG